MTIKLHPNGNVVLKDGLVSCECCGPTLAPCQSDIIQNFYGLVGFPPYTRANISPATAALLRQGGLINYSFSIEINGVTPDGASTMSGGMGITGTTLLTSANGCRGSISIQPAQLAPSFLLNVASGGTINAFVQHNAQIFLQQQGGGWPNSEDTTTNEQPALFIVSSGQITWGAIWGHNWVVSESGDQSIGTLFGQVAKATTTPRASFSNAAIESLQFSLSIAAP